VCLARRGRHGAAVRFGDGQVGRQLAFERDSHGEMERPSGRVDHSLPHRGRSSRPGLGGMWRGEDYLSRCKPIGPRELVHTEVVEALDALRFSGGPDPVLPRGQSGLWNQAPLVLRCLLDFAFQGPVHVWFALAPRPK